MTAFDLDVRDGVDAMTVTITRWRGLPDEDAPEEWDRLRAFVDWLAERYELSSTTIPKCWYRHTVLVEELSALRAAWDASFVVETDGGLGPIGWHEKFAFTRERMQKHGYNGDCQRRGHEDPPRRVIDVDESDWAEWRRTA